MIYYHKHHPKIYINDFVYYAQTHRDIRKISYIILPEFMSFPTHTDQRTTIRLPNKVFSFEKIPPVKYQMYNRHPELNVPPK